METKIIAIYAALVLSVGVLATNVYAQSALAITQTATNDATNSGSNTANNNPSNSNSGNSAASSTGSGGDTLSAIAQHASVHSDQGINVKANSEQKASCNNNGAATC